MLDLDKYMDNSVKIRLFGVEYDVMEPTMEMVMKVDKLEEDLNADNMKDKHVDLLLLFMNHNKQGKTFTKEEVCKLPYEAIMNVIGEVTSMRYAAEEDPNLSSQSRTEKSDD